MSFKKLLIELISLS